MGRHRSAFLGLSKRTTTAFLATAGALIGFASLSANASPAPTNLVQDPYFNSGVTVSEQFGTYSAGSAYTPAQTLANWASAGYSFVFVPPLTTAANDSYGTSNLLLDTAVTVYNAAHPNFLGADGNTGVAAITQTITGLTPGQEVAISFAWAGAQQTGFTCPAPPTGCTSNWTVDLGSSPTQNTGSATYQTQGFTGWITETMYFLPTSTSEVLSFLAGGTPNSGSPPFALLTAVSVTTVTEPASIAVLLSGLVGVAAFARRRRAGRALTLSA